MNTLIKLFVCGCTLAVMSAAASAQAVTTYPGPSGITASDQYAVSVNGTQSFIYKTNNKRGSGGGGLSISYSYFAFSGGPVTVTVTKLSAGVIDSAVIRPLNKNLTATISGNTVSYTISQPTKVSVEINGNTDHKLFIFADAPEVNPPAPGATNVIYFAPGVHTIGKDYPIPAGKTVYIAGGAYVKGTFNTTKQSNVAVKGRGILSGETFGHVDGPGNMLFWDCTNVTVEGIISVDSPGYHVSNFYNRKPTSGTNSFKNLKLMGWLDNTDGIHPHGNSTVDDLFYFGHDDAIDIGQNIVKLTVTNCTIWNFWGSALLFSWNSQYASNVLVDGIDVIHWDLNGSWNGTAVFYMIHGEPGALRNFTIQNVRVESMGGTNTRFLGLQLMKTQYSNAGSSYGSLDNVYFKNIQIDGPSSSNFISGYDATHKVSNIIFDNLSINGQVCETTTAANITTNAFAENISFVKKNHMTNWSFEAAPAGTQTPAGWTTTSASSADADSTITTDSYLGNLSLQHSRSSAYTVYTSQTLTNLPNGIYTLSARVKSSGGQTACYMDAKDFGGTAKTVNIPTASAWTTVTVGNINVVNGQCTIGFYSNSPGNKWLKVDQVMLWQPYGVVAGSITKADNITALSSAGSWTYGGVPAATDAALWNGAYSVANATASIGTGLTVDRVVVTAPSQAMAISAGTGSLTLLAQNGTGIDLSTASQNFSIAAPIVLGANQTWDIANGRTLTVSGAISGSGKALTKSGTGTLALSGALNFTDGLTATAGTVSFSRSGATTVAGPVTAPGATLSLTNVATQLVLNQPAGSYSIGTLALVSGSTLEFTGSGSTALNLTQPASGSILKIAGGTVTSGVGRNVKAHLQIAGGNLSITNAADRLSLTYGQTLTINSGTLTATPASYGVRLGNDNGSGSAGGSSVTINQTGGSFLLPTGSAINLGGAGSNFTATYNLSGGLVSQTGGGGGFYLGADVAGTSQTSLTLSGGKLLLQGTLGGSQADGAKQAFVWTGGTLATSAANMSKLVSSTGAQVVTTAPGTLTNAGGTLAPGDVSTSGKTTITGNYTVTSANAELAVDIGGPLAATGFQNSGTFDTVAVSGTTSLAGSLRVGLISGFAPASDHSFTVLTSTGALTGSFANVAFGSRLATTDGAGSFLVSQVGDTVVLSQYVPTIMLAAPAGLAATALDSEVDLTWSASAGATSYIVKRATTSGGPYATLASNVTGTSYGDITASNGVAYYYVVAAANASGTSVDSAEVSGTPGSATGFDAWSASDIGAPALTGNTTYLNGSYTLSAGGADIWGTTDQFQFMQLTLVGDGAIVARVNSVQNTNAWAKAGVMIRESLAANARYVGVFVTPGNGVTQQWRGSTGGSTSSFATAALTAPHWVKLARVGNTFTTYRSLDGVTWTQQGSAQTIAMAATVQVGLALTSHNAAALCTATFDQVSLLPGAEWSSGDIGAVQQSGFTNYNAGELTITASGADIFGTADEFRYVHQPASGDCDITVRVVAVGNTDPWAKAGVMIRESSSANAAYAAVYVTPGNGVSFQCRTSANASAANLGTLPGRLAPSWLHLIRVGDVFTASTSTDGFNWTLVGSTTFTLASEASIGVAHTSHNDPELGSADFGDILVNP